MNSHIFQKQYPIALQALGLHMQIHDLPAPAAIDVVEHHHFATRDLTLAISVRMPAPPAQRDAWIASVLIDREVGVEFEVGTRTTWSVRLPDTGFRFEFVGLTPARTVVPV